ncbi:AraC family transcriptional regulator [Paenibacillus pabuli]|uniref:AraC family transcriptional regulator n=1 Tax=Paenibacillus pabuli TaxID=1472 RepID=UPI00078485A7|nr:AraC family transcriptional regulator [Paenibacillus pabuli]MEC0128203.1 AraC family transcriptional regulator [Paenibacillus pabuli]
MNPVSELARKIARIALKDGVHATAIPELFFRRVSIESEPTHSIHMPSLYVIVQGSKTAALVGESFQLDPGTYMVTSMHLPVIGKIMEATPEKPYLSLALTLNPDVIVDINKKYNSPPKERGATSGRSILVNPSTPPLLDAMLRLVHLLDTPADIDMLSPLVIREIFYRVLQGEQGALIRQFAVFGTYAQGISSAIHLINTNYSKPLIIEELAAHVSMSPTTFHKQFKQITAMTPLQYQKTIRLQTARRLLLTEGLDAATAGFRVGYESPSQFSREYARLFGRPPMSDIQHLHNSLGRG